MLRGPLITFGERWYLISRWGFQIQFACSTQGVSPNGWGSLEWPCGIRRALTTSVNQKQTELSVIDMPTIGVAKVCLISITKELASWDLPLSCGKVENFSHFSPEIAIDAAQIMIDHSPPQNALEIVNKCLKNFSQQRQDRKLLKTKHGKL